MDPASIAPLAAFLTTGHAADVTGQACIIYGGIVAHVRLPRRRNETVQGGRTRRPMTARGATPNFRLISTLRHGWKMKFDPQDDGAESLDDKEMGLSQGSPA